MTIVGNIEEFTWDGQGKHIGSLDSIPLALRAVSEHHESYVAPRDSTAVKRPNLFYCAVFVAVIFAGGTVGKYRSHVNHVASTYHIVNHEECMQVVP
ncbi:hypothetical protein J4211_03635 [Candidatus Woesearchaeota archaeon]|nr:hypothetical protein [Candidatus Woesearchaeota archaeon]